MSPLAAADPLTVPTWTAAIATVVLAIGAIVTVYFAKRAFDEQSKELGVLQEQAKDQADQLDVQREQADDQRKVNEKQTTVLELQAKELQASIDQRELQAAEQRRAQAARVFIWEERGFDAVSQAQTAAGAVSGETVTARVRNASDLPVYHLLFSWHLGTAPSGQHPHPEPLMPGDDAEDSEPVPDGANPDVFGAVAFFWDAAGVCWRARPDGKLDEIPEGQQPPRSW